MASVPPEEDQLPEFEAAKPELRRQGVPDGRPGPGIFSGRNPGPDTGQDLRPLTEKLRRRNVPDLRRQRVADVDVDVVQPGAESVPEDFKTLLEKNLKGRISKVRKKTSGQAGQSQVY